MNTITDPAIQIAQVVVPGPSVAPAGGPVLAPFPMGEANLSADQLKEEWNQLVEHKDSYQAAWQRDLYQNFLNVMQPRYDVMISIAETRESVLGAVEENAPSVFMEVRAKASEFIDRLGSSFTRGGSQQSIEDIQNLPTVVLEPQVPQHRTTEGLTDIQVNNRNTNPPGIEPREISDFENKTTPQSTNPDGLRSDNLGGIVLKTYLDSIITFSILCQCHLTANPLKTCYR